MPGGLGAIGGYVITNPGRPCLAGPQPAVIGKEQSSRITN